MRSLKWSEEVERHASLSKNTHTSSEPHISNRLDALPSEMAGVSTVKGTNYLQLRDSLLTLLILSNKNSEEIKHYLAVSILIALFPKHKLPKLRIVII